MAGTFLARARFQDSDFSQEAIKMVLRCILNVILHFLGFKFNPVLSMHQSNRYLMVVWLKSLCDHNDGRWCLELSTEPSVKMHPHFFLRHGNLLPLIQNQFCCCFLRVWKPENPTVMVHWKKSFKGFQTILCHHIFMSTDCTALTYNVYL